jgi:preprotein translocase subunit SecA
VQLTDRVKEQLIETFGEEHFRSIASTPLRELSAEDAGKIVTLFGARLQNEIYRDVLLGVISQLWVDYLTRVDALRVSIGLEAYAQRDPLVQYKGRASEMFKELLGEIRSGVVARMFTYQPRRSAAVSAGQERAEAEPVSATTAQSGPESRSSRKKKRRRH